MRKVIAILFALCSVFFTSAKALTITNADAFAPGDGKAIYDTTTGLTWLDFGISNGIFLNDVISQLGSGKYSEWRLPTESEVLQLFKGLITELEIPEATSEEDMQTQTQVEGYDIVWSDIYSLWGFNDSRSDEEAGTYSFSSRGVFVGNDGKLYGAGFLELAFPVDVQKEEPYYVHILLFNLRRAWSHETTEPYVSTFLVRDTPFSKVLEPTPALLLFFGVAAIIFRRVRV